MAIENVLASVQTANKYIVSANSKLGVAGFSLMAITEYTFDAQSEMTDHRIETGQIAHDYITNRPEELVVGGIISELYFENPLKKDSFREKVAETARYAFNIANTLSIAASSVQSVLNVDSNTSVKEVEGAALDLWKNVEDVFVEQSTVKKAKRFFMALRDARETVTVSTPFGVENNMVITGISISTKNTMFGSAIFSIRLKKANFVKPLTSNNQPITIAQAQKNITNEIKQLQTGTSEVYTNVSNFIGGL